MSKYLSANEIYPGLWLGDIVAGSNLDFLKKNNIKYVFNCTKTMPFCKTNGSWKLKGKFRVPVLDDLSKEQIYKMYLQLDKCAKLIAKLIVKNSILVHCHAGRQRSLAVVIAFLMRYGHLSKDEAVRLVRSKRCVAGLPSVNFDKALIQYQQDLITQSSLA